MRTKVKNIDWAVILHGPQYIGFRITMIGVAMGFVAFVTAMCGFMYLGISVFAVGLSTAFTGIVINFSHVNRRK
jgi:hypothetical protein